jgi:AGZA family xanthine/uracil permease-like MFS transporter
MLGMSFPVSKGGYHWADKGDINAYFAFMLDCIVNLFVLSALLTAFGFPAEIIYTRIIPGAVAAITIGNIGFAWLSFRTAKQTGNPNITAPPSGLDMPTTVAMVIAVMGPVFIMEKSNGLAVEEAATIAWHIGMAATIWIGVTKAILSFFSRAIAKFVPPSALIGAIVGIAIVWLGANAMYGVMELPTVGLLSFAIMAIALIAGHVLPGRFPGAVLALLVGTLAYYVLGSMGVLDALGHSFSWPSGDATAAAIPMLNIGGLNELFGGSLVYLPAILPFAVLVAASAINITTALKLVGDDFRPDRIIQVDAAATILGALLGSVVQTTAYFGHTTYKRMGARSAYVLAVAFTVMVGGFLGVISTLIGLIPGAAIKPILIVVAFDIVRLAFERLPGSHGPVIAIAMLPGILNFTQYKVGELLGNVSAAASRMSVNIVELVSPMWLEGYQLLLVLSRGYVVTSLLWAAALAFIIDGKFMRAGVIFIVASVSTMFGIIHSIHPSGALYLPWNMPSEGVHQASLLLPVDLASGYGLAAVTVFVVGWWIERSGEVVLPDHK